MQTQQGFRQKLTARQAKTGSMVCVGLDPLPEKIPSHLVSGTSELHIGPDVVAWMTAVVDTTAPYASMFKPQRAYWEAIPNGEWALRAVVNHIKKNYPDIVVFLDCKRGDIGRTQERYREAHFGIDKADGVNFSPYMGKDCMEYFFDKDHPGRALVGLCYTSNPSSRAVQDIKLADGRFYWEFIAQEVLGWAEELGVTADAGLVMAAAYETPKGSGKIFSEHLSRCREIIEDKLWFLIPGIGTQGGAPAQTVQGAFAGWGSIAVNSSSEIINASKERDFAQAAGNKARELRDVLLKSM